MQTVKRDKNEKFHILTNVFYLQNIIPKKKILKLPWEKSKLSDN